MIELAIPASELEVGDIVEGAPFHRVVKSTRGFDPIIVVDFTDGGVTHVLSDQEFTVLLRRNEVF